jgi:hypothetical protein
MDAVGKCNPAMIAAFDGRSKRNQTSLRKYPCRSVPFSHQKLEFSMFLGRFRCTKSILSLPHRCQGFLSCCPRILLNPMSSILRTDERPLLQNPNQKSVDRAAIAKLSIVPNDTVRRSQISSTVLYMIQGIPSISLLCRKDT